MKNAYLTTAYKNAGKPTILNRRFPTFYNRPYIMNKRSKESSPSPFYRSSRVKGEFFATVYHRSENKSAL